jgi:hypothetical protein
MSSDEEWGGSEGSEEYDSEREDKLAEKEGRGRENDSDDGGPPKKKRRMLSLNDVIDDMAEASTDDSGDDEIDPEFEEGTLKMLCTLNTCRVHRGSWG